MVLCPIKQLEPIVTLLPIKTFFPNLTLSLNLVLSILSIQISFSSEDLSILRQNLSFSIQFSEFSESDVTM